MTECSECPFQSKCGTLEIALKGALEDMGYESEEKGEGE